MGIKRFGKLIVLVAVLGVVGVLTAKQASAVPSFARQTGMSRSVCHTMFPELTPFGRTFKLTGYVLNSNGASHPSKPPVAAMAQFSYTHTNAAQPAGSLPTNGWALHNASSGNDVFGTPQVVSVFYGGQIYGHVGALVQATWENDGNLPALDMADIRYAKSIPVCGKDLIYGLTFNNNPTSEDVWNSTPAWGFPYAASNVAPTPAADVAIDNSLSALVGGGGVYGYWNNTIYAAVSVYRSALNGPFSFFAVGDHPLGAYAQGPIPYWRVALTHQYGSHWFEIGTYGMSVNEFSLGAADNGPTDNFLDTAIDGQYQYINGNQVFSLAGTWIHENQDHTGSVIEGLASNPSDHLNTFRVNGNYYYRTPHCGQFGGTVAYFSTTGSDDATLYSSSANPSGSPDSRGEILEVDYMPAWHNYGPTGLGFAKFSLQYVIYNKFNGSTGGASDNNTLYLLAWLVF
jgi:hypothetical protein